MRIVGRKIQNAQIKLKLSRKGFGTEAANTAVHIGHGRHHYGFNTCKSVIDDLAEKTLVRIVASI